MMGHSHSLSGGVAGLTAGIVLHYSLPATAALALATAGTALLPDLDSTGSCAARCFGWLSRPVAYVIRFTSGGHRHSTHSVIGVAIFTALAVLACHYRHDYAGMAGLAFLVALSVSAGLEALRVSRFLPLPRALRHGHAEDLAGVLAAAAVVWGGYGLALIPLAVALGCATHIAGDMLTDSGCMLAYPFSSYRFHLLPEPAAFTTGTDPERYVVDPLLGISLAALAGLAIDPASGPLAWHAVLHYV
jgi:membrane-bound metal-dependent hydrolase YbcI (DUF457 family)